MQHMLFMQLRGHLSIMIKLTKSIWNHISSDVSPSPSIHNYFQMILQIQRQSHPRPYQTHLTYHMFRMVKVKSNHHFVCCTRPVLGAFNPLTQDHPRNHVGSSLVVVWTLCSQTQTHKQTRIYVYCIYIYTHLSIIFKVYDLYIIKIIYIYYIYTACNEYIYTSTHLSVCDPHLNG